MDKMKMHTPDITESNIEKIGQLFPNCLTERIGENGQVERVIDFDMLRQELSKEIVEGPQERYRFTWPDKKKAIRLANTPSTMTLRPCREESVDFNNTENLYIEGDNLDVLKLLRENYLGRVKMIYIDPPYNTGNDFIYEDDFSQTVESFLSNSGQIDEQGNRLVQNTDSNGRFHTDWLNMLYPRLKVSKDLLSDDGVIFVHIDDNEVENLGKLLSEVFGDMNFINLITVKTKIGGVSGSSEGKSLKDVTEFIWAYAKNKGNLLMNPVYNYSPLYKYIQDYVNNGKSWKYTSVITRLDGKQLIKRDEKTGMAFYGYSALETQSIAAFAKKMSISEEQVYERYADRIFRTTNAQSSVRQTVIKETLGYDFPMYGCEYIPIKGKNEGTIIEILYKAGSDSSQKNMVMFLSDVVERIGGSYYYKDKVSSLWDDIDYNNLTKEGDIEFPSGKKPIKLIQRLLSLTTEKESLVLDFFSGSASTAHAVMQLNSEDGGKRKFIMVQLPEATDEKSDLFKEGLKTICDVGKERIRRAGKKIIEERAKNESENSLFSQDESKPKIDVGFRVLKLDTSNMNDVYYKPEEFSDQLIKEDNVKTERSSEDLLFQVMLECNLPLSAKIKTEKISGKEVFSVNDGYLVACFDENVNEEVIKAVAKRKPYYFVMRDSSLSSDNVADNFEQIFQAYSKDTIRRIL